MFNLDLPTPTERVGTNITRVAACVMIGKVCNIGLLDAKHLLDNNFPGYGDVSARAVSELIREFLTVKGL